MMQTVNQDRPVGAAAPVLRNEFSRRAKAALQVGVIFLALAGTAMANTNHTPTPGRSGGDIGIHPRLGNQVPLDLKFQDETGQTVTLGSYFEGKPVILSLVYYGCRMMCTLTQYGLVHALKEIPDNIGDQYLVVTVSFDPREKSDVAMVHKNTYVNLYGRPSAGQGWHFLVGDEPSIRALTESVGFHYQYLADIDLFSHPTGIMILTPTGKVSSYFYGTQFFGQDIHLALADASHEKIDSPEVINARMQKGMAGGGTSAGMNPTAKPQCAPPMVNHPVATTAPGPEAKQ